MLIVDEFTGRILDGRRYSEGLHQAIEAKEKVPIREENQTLATITLQNYFRLYDDAGRHDRYGQDRGRRVPHRSTQLEVVQIPTNAPMVRLDENDFIFTTAKEKYAAVVDDIVERYEKGQPVLVGTVSVEVSEMLSRLLERHGVPHNVLNAKQHEREAEIIENAGQKGAVTIATNMAGRGVDIKLGEGVLEAGGLYVLGTERHESRRIDNQLRGRSGRQGDPGESRFYLSAEDDLIRLFAGDRMYRILSRLGPAGGRAARGQDAEQRGREGPEEGRRAQLHAPQERAQVRRGHERAAPRHLRPAQRILMGEDFGDQVREMVEQSSSRARSRTALAEARSTPRTGTSTRCSSRLRADLRPGAQEGRHRRGARRPSTRSSSSPSTTPSSSTTSASALIGEEQMRSVERAVMLQVIDGRWKDHLLDMDYLQEGIHLRALGQRDPLVEYKTEGFDLFEDMLEGVKTSTVTTLMKNTPEDLAMFTAMTLDEPVVAAQLHERRRPGLPDLVHRRGDGRRRSSPAGRRLRRPARRPTWRAGHGGGAAARSTGAGRRAAAPSSTRRWGATTRARAGAGRSTRSVTARERLCS